MGYIECNIYTLLCPQNILECYIIRIRVTNAHRFGQKDSQIVGRLILLQKSVCSTSLIYRLSMIDQAADKRT